MTKSSFQPLVVAALVLSVSGCDCNKPSGTRTRGEPRLLIDTGGVNVETDTLDFGTVAMGKRVTSLVTVSNVAAGPLQIDAWTRVGDAPPVKLGASLTDANPVFGLEYAPGELTGGESLQFTAFFEPPIDARTEVEHEVKLLLKTSNSVREELGFTFRGKGIRGECELPDRFDFGAVARGDRYSFPITLKNPRPIEVLPNVEAISGGDGAFTFTPDSPRGEFSIPPGGEKTVTIEFTPSEAREYFATVRIRAGEGCPDKNVRLLGTGVDQVLSWMPDVVQFGYVQPGLSITRDVTFVNQGFKDVVIANLLVHDDGASVTTASNSYRVSTADPGDLTKLTIPKASRDPMTNLIVPGTKTATLSFSPTMLGPRDAWLVGAPNVTNQTAISVSVKGFGGGPDIEVLPANTLNFGRIAYFAGANSYATRRVTVRNVGTKPTVGDPAANLKLGARGMGKPYWRVTAKNAASDVSEICVGVFDVATSTCANDLPATGMGFYEPQIGIEAAGARASLDIPIRITPANTNLGPTMTKEWDVTFFSNDPDEPEVTITVTARPVLLPPCNASVSPLSLGFGVVTPPISKDLSFEICNLGTAPSDVCLISGLDLEAGTDGIFSLPAGSQAETDLNAGQCMTVVTRAWPQGLLPANPTPASGAVTFNLSSPTQPQRRVQLSATLAPSCLVISPSTLDFGTVQEGCNSPTRNFLIYNACAQPVKWVSADLVASGGVAPGTPRCSGTNRCPEFSVPTAPNPATLPACTMGGGQCLLQGGAPLTFQARYQPLDLGADTGAYQIKVVQSGQTVDYLVTLQGRGDVDGSNTDVFRQDARPKADILLVIDDSCSMLDKQNSLGQNFDSFIKFATTSKVDFQIGVTTTDADDELSCPNCITGDLKASSTGAKIFTPTTPDLELQFQQVVKVGTSGSPAETCMAPAVRALTAPKITDPSKNAGLLRPDAVLAVVCVTDAPDQATQPVSFYLNQLRNIKGAQRPGAFTYNVIGPFLPSAPSGSCVYDGSGDDGKHTQLVSQTNGVKEEICTPRWATALENIGKAAFGFRTNFYLTSTPDLRNGNVITVQIDGQPVPQVDVRGSPVWRYNAATNAIVFEPLYVPEPGRTMTVQYKVACL